MVKRKGVCFKNKDNILGVTIKNKECVCWTYVLLSIEHMVMRKNKGNRNSDSEKWMTSQMNLRTQNM